MAKSKRLLLFSVSLTFLILGAIAGEASAATIYVSTNGNDSNPGTISAPVATVKQAFNLASPGDTITLRGGDYFLTRYLWIDKEGLTFTSYPQESAAIIGSNTDTTNLGSLLIINARNVTLKNLEIRGGSYYAIKLEQSVNTVIRNCRIYNSGRDCVKTFNADNLLIEGCDIGPSGVRDGSNAEGIDVIGSKGVTIRDSYIHDTATTGIYVKGGATNAVIERNYIERTGHAGILLGQDTDPEFMRDGTVYECLNSVARNNIIVKAEGAGIGSYSGKNVRFENNTLYDVARSYNGGFYIAMNGRDVPTEDVKFKNNIVVVFSSRPMVFTLNMKGQFVSDSNIWFRPSGGVYKFWRETPTRGDYWESFAAWQVGMGADSNSMTVDPKLDAKEMYIPGDGSLAIDHGETIEGVTVDFAAVPRPQGGAFDIGAHEFAASGVPPGDDPPPPPPNQSPVVSITVSKTSGIAPLTVQFTSSAKDADGQVVGYNWTFGDGESSSQASPSHLYKSAGNYTARLTVSDNQGATASAEIVIGVKNSQPVEPKVRMLSPNTNIKVSGGSSLTITWEVTGTGLWRQDIQFTLDGGATWKDIVNGLPGTATKFDWTVPNQKTRAARVRVITYGDHVYTGQDESDSNFTIVKVKGLSKKR